MNTAPIKRHEVLRHFSREHHHGLLLCWKIRQGLQINISIERIKKYSDWLWNTLLKQHFMEEEKYIFTNLNESNPLIIRAKAEHKKLTGLFENSTDVAQSLRLIEKELESHIRFEERILFNELQSTLSANNLAELVKLHRANTNCATEDWPDKFWELKK